MPSTSISTTIVHLERKAESTNNNNNNKKERPAE
jgi:hypothetical protein